MAAIVFQTADFTRIIRKQTTLGRVGQVASQLVRVGPDVL